MTFQCHREECGLIEEALRRDGVVRELVSSWNISHQTEPSIEDMMEKLEAGRQKARVSSIMEKVFNLILISSCVLASLAGCVTFMVLRVMWNDHEVPTVGIREAVIVLAISVFSVLASFVAARRFRTIVTRYNNLGHKFEDAVRCVRLVSKTFGESAGPEEARRIIKEKCLHIVKHQEAEGIKPNLEVMAHMNRARQLVSVASKCGIVSSDFDKHMEEARVEYFGKMESGEISAPFSI